MRGVELVVVDAVDEHGGVVGQRYALLRRLLKGELWMTVRRAGHQMAAERAPGGVGFGVGSRKLPVHSTTRATP